MTALVAILAVAVVLLGVLVAGLLRSHAEILRALHRLGVSLDPDADESPAAVGPPRRQPTGLGPATDVTGVTPALTPIVVATRGADRRTLLAFLSSGCLTCHTFWDRFADRDFAPPGGSRLVIVTNGPDRESPSEVAALAPDHVVTVMSTDAWDAYRVPGSPYFVLVDGAAGSVVGEGTAASWPQVEQLLTSALADAGVADRHHHRVPNPSDRDVGPQIDADLRAAGIGPGHPSLYPAPPDPEEGAGTA
ncbi:MAG: hypothetical protein ACRD29_11160 [Acidimicrobiales bacterium]